MINNEFTRKWLRHIAEELNAPTDFGNVLPVQVVQVEDIANAVPGSCPIRRATSQA